jgi:hypothetical protein
MAQTATGLLLERVAGTGPAEPQEIILPTRLIVRQSSGVPLDANSNATVMINTIKNIL